MKTKVRVQEFSEYGANFKTLQIIEQPRKDDININVIGFIKFSDYQNNKIFELREFICKSQEFNHFLKMGKIAKFINNEAGYSPKFETVLSLIGAEIYTIQHNEFISERDRFKNLYLVNYENSTGEITGYKRIIAATEKLAYLQVDKLDIKKPSLELIGQLT